MYVVKTKVGDSQINGKGVFADENIPRGKTVWVYDPNSDMSLTNNEYEDLENNEKRRFDHSAYLSPWTGLWICPPKGDNSEYTNHSTNSNLSVKYDQAVSVEPYFVANRDIEAGEELTNNYNEFDEITRNQKPEWAQEAER